MVSVNRLVLEEYGPKYFKAVKEHLLTLHEIEDFTGEHTNLRRQSQAFVTGSGVSSSDLLRDYDNSMLAIDEFRITVIIYACVCLITKHSSLSIGGFRYYSTSINDAVPDSTDTHDMIKYLSENIDIDTFLVPDYIKKTMAKHVEEKEANKICNKLFDKLNDKNARSSFETFSEYMTENSRNLIDKLNSEGYMNTHSVEVLSDLMILRKIGFPVPDLYIIKGDLPVPKELLHALTKKMFEVSTGDNSGGILGLGDI